MEWELGSGGVSGRSPLLERRVFLEGPSGDWARPAQAKERHVLDSVYRFPCSSRLKRPHSDVQTWLTKCLDCMAGQADTNSPHPGQLTPGGQAGTARRPFPKLWPSGRGRWLVVGGACVPGWRVRQHLGPRGRGPVDGPLGPQRVGASPGRADPGPGAAPRLRLTRKVTRVQVSDSSPPGWTWSL